jgi:hypothetical protein
LQEAGINFDAVRANDLVKKIEQASVELTAQKRAKDATGAPLDKVALNKAMRSFENAGREWQIFAKEILDQEARLTSTGKATELKTAVEKKKIEAKPRIVPKGTSTKAEKREGGNPHPYGTKAYYDYQADETMEVMAKRARAYA